MATKEDTGRALMGAALNAGQAGQSPVLYGGMSPLVQSYEQTAYGRRLHELPRPPEEFTIGAFGPGMPLIGQPVDEPKEDGTILPRRTQYPVSWNLPTGTPGNEGLGKMASFATLRAMADKYPITRRCIEARKAEIIGLDWDIIPTPNHEKAMEGSTTIRTDWQKRKAEVMAFFQRPDRSPDSPYKDWAEWMYAMLEDLFVIDAVALYLHPPFKTGKGWFGSQLASLDLCDGSTFRPLYDMRGGLPPPSTPAYQQFLWGVPRSDFSQMSAGRDVEEIGDFFVKNLTTQELLYLHMVNRTWAPYGFSPVEQSLLPIAIGYARMTNQLEFWTEGSAPYLFVIPGDGLISSAQQVRQLQTGLNAISGDTGWKWKNVVLPPGSKTEQMKPAPLGDQFDELIASFCAMQWGMSASDLGIFPAVAQTQSASQVKLMGQVQTQNASARWLEPITNRLADVHQWIISYVFKQNDMLFNLSGLEQPQDLADKIESAIELTKASIISVDEARQEIGREPLGLPETSVPLVFTGTGAVPLSLSIAQAQAILQHPAPVFPGAPGKPGGANHFGLPEKPESSFGTGSTGAAGRGGQQSIPAPGLTADPSGLSTPMHEAAAAVAQGAKPSAQPTSRSKAELQILDRFLQKGKSIDDFVPEALSEAVIEKVRTHLPGGRENAISAGRAEIMAEWGRKSRDYALRRIENDFARPLGLNLRRIGLLGLADETVADVRRAKLGILAALGDARQAAMAASGLDGDPTPSPAVVKALIDAAARHEDIEIPILLALDHIREMWPENSPGRWEKGVISNPPPYTERYLIRYWVGGAGGRIKWGVPGDFDKCVELVSKYLAPHGIKPEAFCQHAHEMATGAVAGHAPAELAARGKAADFYELAMKGKTLSSGKRVAAGLVVRARSSGRVLLQQRTDDASRPAPGRWEFPGGRVDKDDDTLLDTAKREWEEEVGSDLPDGQVVGSWTSPDGQYEGFVHEIAHENLVAGTGSEHEHTQGVKWMDPAEAKVMPGLREECRQVPWGMIGAT